MPEPPKYVGQEHPSPMEGKGNMEYRDTALFSGSRFWIKLKPWFLHGPIPGHAGHNNRKRVGKRRKNKYDHRHDCELCGIINYMARSDTCMCRHIHRRRVRHRDNDTCVTAWVSSCNCRRSNIFDNLTMTISSRETEVITGPAVVEKR